MMTTKYLVVTTEPYECYALAFDTLDEAVSHYVREPLGPEELRYCCEVLLQKKGGSKTRQGRG